MHVLWGKNGNYLHNDTGCMDTTGSSPNIIKGGFFVMWHLIEIQRREKSIRSAMDSYAKNQLFFLKKTCCGIQNRYFKKTQLKSSGIHQLLRLIRAYFQKDISYRVHRACPTNGSDCGSLRSHNLTLFVRRKYRYSPLANVEILGT